MKIAHIAEAYLDRVRLRLMEEGERERFDQLLESRHYLKSSRLGGRSLRYVAEVDGQWVALVSFSGAAPKLKGREKWIGWSPRQQSRRLGLVCNNSRYLLLVERERHPNLASKILGLALRRLPGDWKQRWGHEVLIVESFVDEGRYKGTCYRACGFAAVGASAGFSRDARDYYTAHDQPKQLYLRELRPGARKLLCRPRLPAGLNEAEADIAGPCPFRAPELGSLWERLHQIEDPRQGGHGLHHRMTSTLACAIVATLMGAGSYQAYEDVCQKLTRRQRRALRCHHDRENDRYDVPSDSTFFRVLNLVDPAHLEALIASWLLEQDPAQIERLAVDGKVLRGTARAEGKPLALLSVVTHQLRTTLRSVQIAEKSNEIPAIKPLLSGMDLQGCTVTADAMHCQQETARFITQDLGGDYLFGLKGNQSGILQRAENQLSSVFFPTGK
jgi:hypothetical protein